MRIFLLLIALFIGFHNVAVADSVQETRAQAEKGDAAAQYNLGVMYEKGQGIPQDYAEALKWYRKAADQGLVEAQYQVGLVYANGQGIPQDYAEALKWYRKAAAQGLAKAQYG